MLFQWKLLKVKMKLLPISEMFVLKKWIGRCVQKRHSQFLSILHLNCGIIWLSPFNCGPLPILSALSNKQYRNLLSGENCRTHALTWLLQQAHANQNHSRACFMSLKELVLPGAEVPYLLGNYRFLVWSLLSLRIKLPFFPLLT